MFVGQHDAGADDVLGGEAAIDVQQMIEAEQEHAGEDNERDAGGHFRDDERVASCLPPADSEAVRLSERRACCG